MFAFNKKKSYIKYSRIGPETVNMCVEIRSINYQKGEEGISHPPSSS